MIKRKIPFLLFLFKHMKQFTVSVKKLTDIDLMLDACEMTFNGKSHQSLLSIYRSEHSPARTQMFWVKCFNIPLYISTHLLRHHVGSVPFQLTCRDDRPGGNPGLPKKVNEIMRDLNMAIQGIDENEIDYAKDIIEQSIEKIEWLSDNSDRYTPVNLGLWLNAQSLIDMAKLRLCSMASSETRIVFNAIKDKIREIDPELAKMMVRKCVYRGGICGEDRCCGFNSTPAFIKELKEYSANFKNKQFGFLTNLILNDHD